MIENNINKIESFFELVNLIVNTHEKIAQISGENFNIFKLLGLQTSEVRMHSALLAELLNAKGTHGQGDIFLQLFIAELKNKKLKEINFETAHSKVFVEKYIGRISEDGTEGGRIDILIEDINKNRIIIENKIYAPDQDNQLLRYHKSDTKAFLMYLTLYGKDPSVKSRGVKSNDRLSEKAYQKISYRHDIINWLEQCKKEVALQPIIRETIVQYIHILESLTNQTKRDKMHEEIIKHAKSSEGNLKIALLIGKSFEELCNSVIRDFAKEMEKQLQAKNHDNVDIEINIQPWLDNPTGLYTGMTVRESHWPENIYVSIEAQQQGKRKYIWGVIANDEKVADSVKKNIYSSLNEKVSSTGRSSEWWAWYQNVEGRYQNFDDLETLTSLYGKRGIVECFTDKISEIAAVLNSSFA